MIEEQISKNIFSGNTEKTFLDKLFAKEDVTAVKELIKKPRLTRSELLELLYLLSSTEAKLVNYSVWDRYIILKFFVWIREFIKVTELIFDYTDFLEVKANLCKKCEGYITKATDNKIKCTCEEPKIFKLSDRTKQYLDNAQRLIEHNAKFLIDLYFNIARTTLSLGATGFLEGLKNKFEISYPEQKGMYTPLQQERTNWLGMKKSG